MIRRLLLPTAIVAAVGGPLLTTNGRLDQVQRNVASFWNSESPESSQPADSLSELQKRGQPSSEMEGLEFKSLPITGSPVDSLSDVLRFNITPDWILHHWPRVTTQLSDLRLAGLRVPLVTGTEKHDLAGSLTYYFDNQQLLQRISFSGYTGDESKLVALLTEKCALRSVPTLHRGLYLAEWGGKARSALRIKHSAIIDAGSSHPQFKVELELNRPRRGYELSQAFADSLDQEQRVGRW